MSILSRSISRRRALAATAGAAAALTAGVAVQSASAAGGDKGGGGMYVSSGQMVEGIVVTGNGVASAEVSAALIQYLVRYAADAPQMTDSTGAAGGGYYGAPVPAPDDDAMAKIVEALKTAGIPAASIKTFPGSDAMYGPFGSGVSAVAAEIDDAALLGKLSDILADGASAAADTKLQIDQIGAIFSTADCESVNDDALANAAADARTQAEALAKAIGVTLGELKGATSGPTYSPYSSYSGGSGACANPPALEDAGTIYFPTFVAGTEPEFTINASITLTFDLAGE